MDHADRFRPCQVRVLDDALRSGSTTADPEGGRYLGIPPEATVVGSAPQSRGAREQLTEFSGRQETLAQRSAFRYGRGPGHPPQQRMPYRRPAGVITMDRSA